MGVDTRDNAFLNVPYDRRYEGLYLAFIAGLSAFGLAPHATVELAGSQRRLDRIIRLLRSCRYSFHDLSRVSLDRNPPATPRFNMPFELGLAATYRPSMRHRWFVFEEQRHRLMPEGVLRALANALVRRRHRPTAAELSAVYQDVRRSATAVRRDLRTKTLFEARSFDELVVAGRISAERRIPSLRRRRQGRPTGKGTVSRGGR